MPEYRGECSCGAVRYMVTAETPNAMFLCHCSRCRKESGSIHAANVFFARGTLTWERRASQLTAFELPGTRKARVFCSTCGSPMPRETVEGHIVLPAGSLDDSSLVSPTAHIFCASGSAWEPAAGEAPRFDEYAEE